MNPNASCAPGESNCGPYRGLIHRFGYRLDIQGKDSPVTLHEGNTPLIEVPRLADRLVPGGRLFVKYEGLNPTGSFKDRGMTTAMTQAVHEGAQAVICASTGNTAASAAAYAARAGLTCAVLIPSGNVALGKLAGALAYGAKVISIEGSFDDGLRIVRELGGVKGLAVVNSVNPARLQGQKTAAWEVCDQLGDFPDWLCLPVGNAGNISAYWMGFQECREGKCGGLDCQACGRLRAPERPLPRLLGAQAAGAAPLVKGHPILKPETKATAIRIGNPARGAQALQAIAESNGHLCAVTDDEIFKAYGKVAKAEGIFCEPSSAAGIAGLRQAVEQGTIDPKGKTFVCVLTGHGMKDPDSVLSSGAPIFKAPASVEAVLQEIQR